MNVMTKELRTGSAGKILLAALLFAVATHPALAQDFDQVAPKQPKAETPGTVMLPKEAPPPAASHQQLLPALKGLRFVDTGDAIVKSGVGDEGVAVYGSSLTLLNDPAIKQKLAADFLSKPVSFADLDKVATTVRDLYRAHGLAVVGVAFPEQNIQSGTVQVVVTVYRLGRVTVSGNRWFDSGTFKDEMQLEGGEALDIDRLREDLNRLNRNPFHRVDAVLARSETPGETDVQLHVQDRLPLRVYLGYDNEGLAVTGRDRYSAGFNWGDAFGLDQQLSYQFITSPDLWRHRHRGLGLSDKPRFTAHSIAWLAPLPWGDFVNVFGAYVEMVPDLGPNFGQVAHSLQLSARYIHEMVPLGQLSQQLQFGFDYKRADSNLAFGGYSLYANATNVEQFLLVYDGTLADEMGQTALENQLVISPGGLSDGNTTQAFQSSGTSGARSNYIYDHLTVTRVTQLPWEFSSVIRAEGQIASTELLPSEQLGGGGADSVRGYDPRAVNGSEGALASFELRSPTLHPLQAIAPDAAPAIDDSAQLLAFYDYGYVGYKHAQQALARHAELQSAGVGLRYGIGRYLDARFDYGWQLEKLPGAKSLGNLATVSVTLSY